MVASHRIRLGATNSDLGVDLETGEIRVGNTQDNWSEMTQIPGALGDVAPMRTPQWQAASSVVTTMQASHGWTGSTGFVANDTTDFVLGSQSSNMPTNGAGGTFKIEKTGLSLDLTGKAFRIRFKLDNRQNLNTLQFFASTDSGYTNCYSWILCQNVATVNDYVTEGEWITMTLAVPGKATVTGSPTRSNITALKFTVRDLNTGGTCTLHAQSVELIAEPSTTFANGVVSICYDDLWSSVWTLAKPKLDANGLRATVYSIDDLIGASGRLTLAQMQTMRDQGWEIAAHSRTNADHTSQFTGLSAAEVEANMRAQTAYLRTNGFRVYGTAWPQGGFGKTTDNTPIIDLARKSFNYARTTYGNSFETFPPADRFRLRARSSISSFSGGYAASSLTTTTSGDIDKAKTNCAWLILVFHKIVASSPAATTEILQTDHDAIIDKIISAGMTCLPVADVLAYYG